MAWYKCTRTNQFDGLNVYHVDQFYEIRTVTPPAAFFTLDGNQVTRRTDSDLGRIQKDDTNVRHVHEPVSFDDVTLMSSLTVDTLAATDLSNGNRLLASGSGGAVEESDISYSDGALNRTGDFTVGRAGEGFTDALKITGYATGDQQRTASLALSSTVADQLDIGGVSKISTDALVALPEIHFDLNPTPTEGEGSLFWDSTDQTLNLGMAGGKVNLQIGQEMYLPRRVRNDTGGDMKNGDLVYISGGTGVNINVALAKADATATSTGTIAMLTEDIDDGSQGWATIVGLVRGTSDQPIDTSALAPGTQLYLSATVAGGFTGTPPASPNYCVCIGKVFRQHATEGSIIVNIRVTPRIGELSDVTLDSIADGELLAYSLSDTTWKNKTSAELGLVTGASGLSNVGRMVRVSAAGTLGETDISIGAADGIISRAGALTLSSSSKSWIFNGPELSIIDSAPKMSIETTSTGNVLAYFRAKNTGATGYGLFGVGATGYTTFPLFANRAFALAGPLSDGLVLATESSDPILFVTGATNERMRINSSGQVLVGTTAAVGSETIRSIGDVYVGYTDATAGNRTLTISAGTSGASTAKIDMGTRIRNWNMVVDASPYSWHLDYAGTDAPLANIITVLKSGQLLVGTTAAVSSEIARFNGTTYFDGIPTFAAGAKLANDSYIYLRGDASTDDSIRISYQSSSDSIIFEARDAGTWTAKHTFPMA